MTQITFSISDEQDAQLFLSPAKRLNVEVVAIQSNHQLTEADFWKLIELLDHSDQAWEADTRTQKLIATLTERSVTEIQTFQEILAKKLFTLDKKEFAQQLGERHAWRKNKPFSSDNFLSARAYVVAKGKDFYEKILADPTLMPREDTFEELLYVAETAYENQTGQPFDFFPTVSFETFSNPAGWEKTLVERLSFA